MAAADYLDELEILFGEFHRSRTTSFIFRPAGAFKSAIDLIERTPGFWQKFVLRKLESDCQAVDRFLARPYTHGPNPYLEAVERNMLIVGNRAASLRRPA